MTPVRYFLRLAYDGGPFHGWQVQPNAQTVQQFLNEALSTLLRHPVETTGCGRTDTGVHAREFYAHFDTGETVADSGKFLHSLNAILPLEIAVYELIPVEPAAHARFDAVSRSYEYVVIDHKDPFLLERALYWPHGFDLDRMKDAADLLLTHSDFACFTKAGGASNGTNCTVTTATWEQREHRIVFKISANRFLRNMVRAIVGTLLEVGQGKLSREGFHEILLHGDRSDAGVSVPPHGLYLTRVDYPFIIPNHRG